MGICPELPCGGSPALSPRPTPALLPARAFVVVDTVSKYVLPLRPSYVISASQAFRGDWKQGHFRPPVPAGGGYQYRNILVAHQWHYLIFFLQNLSALPSSEGSSTFSYMWKREEWTQTAGMPAAHLASLATFGGAFFFSFVLLKQSYS